MKYLGIDYGTKRIGIAVSNDEGTLAFPLAIIKNSPDVIRDILIILDQEDIKGVVVGKSVDGWGDNNQIQHAIKNFIKKLSVAVSKHIFIAEQDERGSSVAAVSHLYTKGNIANEKWTGKDNAKKREHHDDNAAAVILQRYLDNQGA